jgi:hypothetical protein
MYLPYLEELNVKSMIHFVRPKGKVSCRPSLVGMNREQAIWLMDMLEQLVSQE